MTRAVLLAPVVVGLAAAVYGAASLTGGWLGTPPWWERVESIPGDFMPAPGRGVDPSGNWCGTPSRFRAPGDPSEPLWLGPEAPRPEVPHPPLYVGPQFGGWRSEARPRFHRAVWVVALPLREWISGGLVGVGLALAIISVRALRRRRGTSPQGAP